jgi:hypothetical protein
MDSIFKRQWSGDSGHPAEDDLLLYVDGELAVKAAVGLRTHLEACWSCRVRTEKIEETISSFIDYRNHVLKPLVVPPPYDWRRFDGKLGGLAEEVGRPSLFANVRGTLGRILSAPVPQLNPGLVLRPAAAVLILASLVAGLIYFNREPVVSASELLQRAGDAQHDKIAATSQAVVYQKLHVRHHAGAVSTGETLTWEVWSDTVNVRSRHAVTDAAGEHLLNIEAKEGSDESKKPGTPEATTTRLDSPAVFKELSKVFQANHMSPEMPLSAASYQAWRSSVDSKLEEVTKTTTAVGQKALTLRTLATSPVTVGGIVEASIVVRESDWHPVEEYLRVKGERGDQEFELTEATYSVVSLHTLSPAIFPPISHDLAVGTATPANSPALASKDAGSAATLVTPSSAPVTATTDLEVRVLQLLSEAGADLGEQVSATRSADGLLHVTGIVETPERKAEIIRQLQPVSNNPAVRIEIQTVAEAVAQQQQRHQRNQSKTPAGAVTEQKIEINNESIAAAPELRRHFNSDEQVRQFAARMVSQSRRAMGHVYAIKKLLGQFSDEELRTLSPEAKNEWLGLIRSHARTYQSEIGRLRNDVQAIFPSAGGVSKGGPEITDYASLAHAVDQLFVSASAGDGVIRSAFATSSSGAATPAISSPQIWQSLRNAEAIAARIAGSR